mgnify:CR=1 FL=1
MQRSSKQTTVQLYVQQPFNKMLTFLPKPCQMAASNEKQRNILLPITIIPTTYLHTEKQDEAHEPECNVTDVKAHGYAITHNTFLQ